MKVKEIQCPKCAAPLSVYPNQGFCQCSYCGSKLEVSWDGSDFRGVRLFVETLQRLQDIIEKTTYLSAKERIKDIDTLIPSLKQELDEKRSALQVAKRNLDGVRRKAESAIDTADRWVIIVLIFMAGAGLATVFSSDGKDQCIFLVVGIVLGVVSWACYQESVKVRQRMEREIAQYSRIVEEAEEEVRRAEACLQSHYIERELCEEIIKRFRMSTFH